MNTYGEKFKDSAKWTMDGTLVRQTSYSEQAPHKITFSAVAQTIEVCTDYAGKAVFPNVNVQQGFTLGWYKSLFHNEMILSALGLSLVLALVSSIIATVLGTLATLGINSMSRKSQLIINNISYVPVVNPVMISGLTTGT